MTIFTVTRTTPLDVERAWAAVTDMHAHGEVVPLTVMRTDPGPPGLGWRFSAGTGAGRVRAWDHMIVTIWDPPGSRGPHGELRIVKIGAWLRGWAQIVVEPHAEGAQVSWTEELGPRLDPIPRLTGPVSKVAGRRMFGAALEELLARD